MCTHTHSHQLRTMRTLHLTDINFGRKNVQIRNPNSTFRIFYTVHTKIQKACALQPLYNKKSTTLFFSCLSFRPTSVNMYKHIYTTSAAQDKGCSRDARQNLTVHLLPSLDSINLLQRWEKAPGSDIQKTQPISLLLLKMMKIKDFKIN